MFGSIAAVIMGSGMILVMTGLGQILGQHEHLSMPIGIAVGAAGMVMLALVYPLYQRVLKRERAKATPEILRLVDKLIK